MRNLERLEIGNTDKNKIQLGIYNRIEGSWETLKDLNKLERLYIENTDINSGWEYLPDSLGGGILGGFHYNTKLRPDCKLALAKTELEQVLWKDIHWGFVLPKYKKKWLEQGYSKEECQDWINVGFSPEHSKEVGEWKKQGFSKEQTKEWIDVGLTLQDYDFANWLRNIENLTPQEVKGRVREIKAAWQSGEQIDKFIQEAKVEKIPYEQFTYITYLAKGGFGKIYQAEWKDKLVILKNLNNSANITPEFLQEIASHKLFGEQETKIIKCHGISQDPEGNYVMVMDYARGGNLRDYLQKNNSKLDLKKKLIQLQSIIEGLRSIHYKGLVHKDFHLGNILSSGSEAYFADLECYITDLGLCKPVSAENKAGEIFGVLPYVAPEVLLEKPYTKKSDIYSFGMVAYGVLSGQPPFSNQPYSINLSLRIIKGERPQFQIKIPQLLEDLIKRCWDTNPEQRPTAEELNNILNKWSKEVNENQDTEFTQQLKEAEEYNKTLPNEIRYPEYKLHPEATQYSKLINTKEITQQLQGSKPLDLIISEELTPLIENKDEQVRELEKQLEEARKQSEEAQQQVKYWENKVNELQTQLEQFQAQIEIPPKK